MYRHFAVITVGITALLAMFASGENGEAIQASLAERQQYVASADKEKAAQQAKRGMLAANFKDNRTTVGSWGGDDVVDRAEGVVRDYTGVLGRSDSTAARALGGQTISLPVSASGTEKLVMPSAPPPGMTMEEYFAAEKLKRRGKLADGQPLRAAEKDPGAEDTGEEDTGEEAL